MTGIRKSLFERNSKKILVVITGVLLLTTDFAFTELHRLVFRLTVKPQSVMRTRSRVYHHDLKPMLNEVKSAWGPVVYRTSTNSLGFRDADARAVSLRHERPRILLIGDSFTEGLGVDFGETFAGAVQKELQPRGIDVLNAAVMSYSPIIYYRKIRYLLEEACLEFDDVVVFLDMSDVQDEVVYRLDADGNVASDSTSSTAENEEQFAAAKAGKWSSRIVGFVDAHMTAGAILLQRVRSLYRGPQILYGVNKRRALWSIDDQVFAAYGREGLERAQVHMEMLRELLARRGIPLTVVVYPWPDQILHDDLDSKQVAFWREWAGKNDVGFLNLFGEFIGPEHSLESLERFYFLGDVHWNRAGHRVVADALLRYWETDPVFRQLEGDPLPEHPSSPLPGG